MRSADCDSATRGWRGSRARSSQCSNRNLRDSRAAHSGSTGRGLRLRRRRTRRSNSRARRRRRRRLLVVNHLAGGDEAAGQQEDDVVAATRAVCGRTELRPVELVADGEVAAGAALRVALLEAVVAREHLRGRVLAHREEQAVVRVCGCGSLRARGGRGRGRQRHDVGFVGGVLARRQRGEGGCGREEQVAAQAVVRVDGVGGLQGDLLLGRGRGHGEVGARGLGDVHGGAGCSGVV
jgi:hypothetical protein